MATLAVSQTGSRGTVGSSRGVREVSPGDDRRLLPCHAGSHLRMENGVDSPKALRYRHGGKDCFNFHLAACRGRHFIHQSLNFPCRGAEKHGVNHLALVRSLGQGSFSLQSYIAQDVGDRAQTFPVTAGGGRIDFLVH